MERELYMITDSSDSEITYIGTFQQIKKQIIHLIDEVDWGGSVNQKLNDFYDEYIIEKITPGPELYNIHQLLRKEFVKMFSPVGVLAAPTFLRKKTRTGIEKLPMDLFKKLDNMLYAEPKTKKHTSIKRRRRSRR